MLAEPHLAPTDARAEFACWLGDGVLALAGWCADGSGSGDNKNSDDPPHLSVRSIVFARDETGDDAAGFLAVATGVASLAPVVLDLDGRCAVLDPARIEVTDAESLAWFGLAGVGPETRRAGDGPADGDDGRRCAGIRRRPPGRRAAPLPGRGTGPAAPLPDRRRCRPGPLHRCRPPPRRPQLLRPGLDARRLG